MTDRDKPNGLTVITKNDIARRDRESRLQRLLGADGKCIVVALDDSAISGPKSYLVDMRSQIAAAVDFGANAILGFEGMFEQYGAEVGEAGRIVNITLSTVGPHHLRKVPINTVESALHAGAHAISVHVNMTSQHEPEMLDFLGLTAAKCRELRIPLFAHMYARKIVDGKEYHFKDLKDTNPQEYAEIIAHGARIAAELGVDVIKVPYTGSTGTFRYVVDSAYGKLVLMAGGEKIDDEAFLQAVHEAMEAGASGVAVGRNFFERTGDEIPIGIALDRIVHGGWDPKKALSDAQDAMIR
jgi:DhnA family fructose-bisphosphate aldolase class Ia